ncbi:MAG: class I SAM-dependent methyltransferase [Anaerolineae bacterium]
MVEFQVGDIEKILACYAQRDIRERVPQITHRMALVESWDPEPGARILEIGCGQGDTTAVLASVIGETGKVIAIDKAPPDYGLPPLSEAHKAIKSSTFADRIEFRLSTDLLSPQISFRDGEFDLAIFSHCSWYLSTPRELFRLFSRVRPWAKRLGYAEWDIVPQNIMQVPHMMAALLQVNIKALCPEIEEWNIRSLIIPEEARRMAEQAGWRIVEERELDTSALMWDGKGLEIHMALKLSEQFIRTDNFQIPDFARDFISAQARMLEQFATHGNQMSLNTYSFLAE